MALPQDTCLAPDPALRSSSQHPSVLSWPSQTFPGLSDSAHVSVLTSSKTDVILDSSVTFRCIDFSRYLPTQRVLVMTYSVSISMYLFSLILNVYSLFYICLCAYVEGHTCHGVHVEVRGQLLALCIWLQKYQVEYIPLGICLASSWPLQNLLRHHLFWAPF